MARKSNSPRKMNTQLDRERAASMADEGGTAAAAMEAQLRIASSPRAATMEPHGRVFGLNTSPWVLAMSGLALGTLGAVIIQRMRGRIEPALQPE